MQLLFVGGGSIATEVSATLSANHRLRVLDPNDPGAWFPGEWRQGDATDAETIAAALTGVEAVVHFASVVPRGPSVADAASVSSAFAVNVGSVYTALRQCALAGVRKFVHISTMSVFAGFGRERIDPGTEPDSLEPYGLSKRLAERVCQDFDATDDIGVVSLRLAFPTPDSLWPRWRRPADGQAVEVALDDGTRIPPVACSDVSRAIDCALGFDGDYRAFAIVGGAEGFREGRAAAEPDLGWEPTHAAGT